MKSRSDPQMEKIEIQKKKQKHLRKVLEEDGLNIAIEYSSKIENYLYIILSCNEGTFSPYQNLDNTFILSSS